MKLNIDGQEIAIEFIHHNNDKASRDMDARWTNCLIHKNGETIAHGIATCSPSDNFCRRTGRRLSLTRAVQQAMTREQRRVFWQAYWTARKEITGRDWAA